MMYVVDGVCYAASEAKEIKVKDATLLRGGMILVTFSNGEKPAIPKKVSFSLLKIP